jgi:HEAT repeat protein
MKNDSFQIRQLAFDALKNMGTVAKDAVPTFLEILAKDEDIPFSAPGISPPGARGRSPSWHEQVIRALSGMIVPESVPALLEALKNTKNNHRFTFAGLLGALGPKAKKAAPTLVELLQDQDPQVHAACRDALKKIDPEAAKNGGVK